MAFQTNEKPNAVSEVDFLVLCVSRAPAAPTRNVLAPQVPALIEESFARHREGGRFAVAFLTR
jgi:hypothetical protein